MKQIVMLVEPLLDETEARLAEAFDVRRLFREADRAGIAADAPKIRAVVTGGGTGLKPEWFDKLPALGIVAIYGVGTDRVNLVRAKARGIHVTTTPGVLTEDVADTGMALLLGVLRRVGEGDRLVREGRWAAGEKLPLGTSPNGKRLGILGLGGIGKALARRATAFGMRIGYWNRSATQAEPGWERFATPIELAAASDVLAVCVAATPETAGMVDRAMLAALGRTGFVVNVARGSVIDEAALIAALQQKTIAGAGLDVFVGEPRIDPAFLTLDNVLLSPHQASATIETRRAMGDLVIANVTAYFAGEAPPTCVVHQHEMTR